MFDKILDFFFPPKCPFCEEIPKNNQPVCSDCMDILPFNNEKSCYVCARPLGEYAYRLCNNCQKSKTYFRHAFIPLIYKDIAKDTAIALKTSRPCYAKGFAFLIADKMLTSPQYEKIDFVTFVPQSPHSKWIRGYNQSELIAKELAKFLKVPCIATLKRTDGGKPQHTLSATERRENVKKCYYKTDAMVSGTVLLVDDIYTTGATANYCSRLLLEMGCEKVYLGIALIGVRE